MRKQTNVSTRWLEGAYIYLSAGLVNLIIALAMHSVGAILTALPALTQWETSWLHYLSGLGGILTALTHWAAS